MPHRQQVVATVVTMIASAAVHAAGSGNAPTVEFDHITGNSQSQAISAKPGEVITITIKNTCPDKFQYEVGGIPLITPTVAAAASAECTLKTHTVTQIHSEMFGGYYVRISPRQGEVTPIMANTGATPTELKNVDYLISVQTLQWDIAFAGGFTIADLVSPVYASQPDSMMQDVVVRDKSAEDEVSLGLAGMIHLYHRKAPAWAASFGLSSGGGGDLAYMLGGSYRFGDKGAVTLGYMWAPVDRLPAGLSVGDPITDPNSFANMQSKIDGGIFLGISYSFISGVKDIFQKPFKGADPSASGGASQAASTSSTPAQPIPPSTPPPPGGNAGVACVDNDTASVDSDGDGVPADQDSDDCDPTIQ